MPASSCAITATSSWPGLRIANLLDRSGARPWRMAVADYERAAAGGRALEGEPVAACWTPELEPTMRQHGSAVHEERVLSALLLDLGAAKEASADDASLGATRAE